MEHADVCEEHTTWCEAREDRCDLVWRPLIIQEGGDEGMLGWHVLESL